ncbi:efflux RND transporter periplasmic adaptor subunit [Pseudoalteromonas spongiae]|uniref:efflux RND transporter periplasmic adaptor subunit n=1 Tax=Pseudoalteromonas spongiae TaxID=298657 RepID=UPI000C2D2D31|nr:efflux RND transporter periplasmic adaptor subunit [Pseudoalteromonas spongiae]
MTSPLSFKYIAATLSLLLLVFNANAQVVRFSEASEAQLQPRKRVVGTLKAFNQANVASVESGKVVKVLVNEGDVVVEGDVLAILDTRRLDAEKQRLQAEKMLADANLALAKAEFTQAEEDYLAYKQSAQKSAVSKQRLNQSKTLTIANQARVIAATQAIKALSAQLNALQVRIDDMSIRAPFDGQVTNRLAELGQWLGSGDHAFTLTSLNKLEAWLDVPERFAFLAGQAPNEIALQIGDELVQAGNIKVLNSVDERARTFRVIGQVNGNGLMPGMSVSAWLPEGKPRTTLIVPKDALVNRGGNYLVYKVVLQGDKQIAQPISVNVQFHQGDKVAVYAPQLAPTDKVITEGNERLMPGPVVAVADTSNGNQQHLK